MKRHHSSTTYRLRVKGQVVQAQLAPAIERGLRKRAAAEGKPVEEVLRDYLAPVAPERIRRRG